MLARSRREVQDWGDGGAGTSPGQSHAASGGGRSFDGSPCPPRIQVHRVRSGGPDAAAVDENQSQ